MPVADLIKLKLGDSRIAGAVLVACGLIFRVLLLLPRLNEKPDNPDALHYLAIAQHTLQTAYSSYREPLFPLFVLLVSLFVGFTYTAVRIASLVAGTLLILGTFKVTEESVGKMSAILAGAFVAFDYLLAIHSVRGLREDTLGLMLLATVYCVVKAEKTSRQKWLAFAGLFGAAAFLTRIDAILVLVVIVAYLVWRVETNQTDLSRRSVLLLAGLFSATAVAFVGWQFASFGEFLTLRIHLWSPEDPKLGNPGFLEILRIRGYFGVLGVLNVWRLGASYFAFTTLPRAFPFYSHYALLAGMIVFARRNAGIVIGAILIAALGFQAYLNGAVIAYANHAYDHRLLFPFLPLGAIAVAASLQAIYRFLEKPQGVLPDRWTTAFTIRLTRTKTIRFQTCYLILLYFAVLLLVISSKTSACVWYYYCG